MEIIAPANLRYFTTTLSGWGGSPMKTRDKAIYMVVWYDEGAEPSLLQSWKHPDTSGRNPAGPLLGEIARLDNKIQIFVIYFSGFSPGK